MNVYRVTFDLVVNGRVQREDTPVARKLIVAKDFYAAAAKARDIQNDLRPGAVHKKMVIRDIRLVFSQVIVDG